MGSPCIWQVSSFPVVLQSELIQIKPFHLSGADMFLPRMRREHLTYLTLHSERRRRVHTRRSKVTQTVTPRARVSRHLRPPLIRSRRLPSVVPDIFTRRRPLALAPTRTPTLSLFPTAAIRYHLSFLLLTHLDLQDSGVLIRITLPPSHTMPVTKSLQQDSSSPFSVALRFCS